MIGLPIDPVLAWNSIPALFKGLVTTLTLTVVVMVLSLVLAVPVTCGRMSQRRIFAWPAAMFVAFFRGAPVLILLYLVYYGFGQIQSLREGPLWLLFGSAFSCAVIGLTLNHTAYLVEIARGSLLAVPAGLVEAGNSLGLTPRETMIWIRIPLALRYGLKAYQNEVIMFAKGTAVVSVITVTDLTAQANEIFEITYDPMTPMISAAAMYWIMINVMRAGFTRLEIYLNRHNRPRETSAVAKVMMPERAAASADLDRQPVPVSLERTGSERYR